MNLKDAWPLTKATFSEYSEDKVPRLSAALAYYTMLSIGPLLIICLKIVGLVAGEEAAKGQIRTYLGQLGLGQAGEAVETIIQEGSRPGAGTIATLISLVVLFFSASGVFGELQDSLDTIWEVKPKPDRSWLDMIKERFFSFTLVLGVAFLLLVSLITSAVLAAVAGALSNAIPGGAVVGQVVNFVVSIAVITGLFALIFKYLPDVDLSWRDVLPGALVTAILFTIGKSLLGWYLARGS
ncbi:MAG: YihY/virulence factor BrkB family protein, partial [Tepidisphaeraceae bacterium]